MNFKERLKTFRANLIGIDPFFMSLYCKLFFKPQEGTIQELINNYARDKSNFKFLQIGGNDGFIKDPIFKFVKKYPWKGIILEPQKEVFNKKLRKTYRFETKVRLENMAIADKTGIKKLWKIALSDSRWATGLASFNKETLIYQIERNYVSDRLKREGISIPEKTEDFLTYENVPCITIQDLMKKHNFDNLDLLQIDTEGYDFEIIKTIDFSQLKPGMISFESEHLSEEDYAECKELLTNHGYKIKKIDRDSVAHLI